MTTGDARRTASGTFWSGSHTGGQYTSFTNSAAFNSDLAGVKTDLTVTTMGCALSDNIGNPNDFEYVTSISSDDAAIQDLDEERSLWVNLKPHQAFT